jgi:hypothetical protein
MRAAFRFSGAIFHRTFASPGKTIAHIEAARPHDASRTVQVDGDVEI